MIFCKTFDIIIQGINSGCSQNNHLAHSTSNIFGFVGTVNCPFIVKQLVVLLAFELEKQKSYQIFSEFFGILSFFATSAFKFRPVRWNFKLCQQTFYIWSSNS
jgi:hypothetical protein